MKTLLIGRDRYEAGGVSSIIRIEGEAVVWCGVERPWRHNWPFISCIPAGEYDLRAYDSPRWGQTWAFVNPDLKVFASMDDALAADCEVLGDEAEAQRLYDAAVGDNAGLRNGGGHLDHGYARYATVLHPANWPRQLNGCIAPGTKRSRAGQEMAVMSSQAACTAIFKVLGPWEPGKAHKAIIRTRRGSTL